MKLIIDISEEYYKQCCESAKSDIGTCTMIANGIPLEQIMDEIERLHYHPKLDYIKNDEVVEMALNIIDKYK